jgi:hypothetical protein
VVQFVLAFLLRSNDNSYLANASRDLSAVTLFTETAALCDKSSEALPHSPGEDDAESSSAETTRQFLAEASRADFLDIVPDLAACLKRVATEYWWIDPEVYAAFEREGFHLTQDVYYSALPNIAQAAAFYKAAHSQPIFAADMLCRAAKFLDVWDEVRAFAGELKDLPRAASEGYCWDNYFLSQRRCDCLLWLDPLAHPNESQIR